VQVLIYWFNQSISIFHYRIYILILIYFIYYHISSLFQKSKWVELLRTEINLNWIIVLRKVLTRKWSRIKIFTFWASWRQMAVISDWGYDKTAKTGDCIHIRSGTEARSLHYSIIHSKLTASVIEVDSERLKLPHRWVAGGRVDSDEATSSKSPTESNSPWKSAIEYH